MQIKILSRQTKSAKHNFFCYLIVIKSLASEKPKSGKKSLIRLGSDNSNFNKICLFSTFKNFDKGTTFLLFSIECLCFYTSRLFSIEMTGLFRLKQRLLNHIEGFCFQLYALGSFFIINSSRNPKSHTVSLLCGR